MNMARTIRVCGYGMRVVIAPGGAKGTLLCASIPAARPLNAISSISSIDTRYAVVFHFKSSCDLHKLVDTLYRRPS